MLVIQRSRLLPVVGAVAIVVGLAGGMNAQAADWSAVSVGCVPDDTTTTPDRYDASAAGGIRFQGTAVGTLTFWCNVFFESDTPDWQTFTLTNLDTGPNGSVAARLYRKQKSDGAMVILASLASSDFAVVKEESVPVVPDFNTRDFAYFVRVQLQRSTTANTPEFHIVSLVWPL